MKINNIFNEKDIVFSCEVFPPKPKDDITTVYNTIETLKRITPDFISVTYGAGGSTKERTIDIASKIKNEYGLEALMHLTCINSSSDDISLILKQLEGAGIENILALRGDIPEGSKKKDITKDFCFAVDLLEFIKKHGDYCVGIAGYPEIHPESYDLDSDINYLKQKVAKGADFIITQLFFQNELLFRFMDKLLKNNINIPVSAGIMPVFKAKLIKKLVTLCGASIPRDLEIIIDKYKDNPVDMEKAGIEYASKQIIDVLAHDFRGIHLYTMNKPALAEKISKNTGLR